MNFLKKLLCNHHFEFSRMTFGDENNVSLPNRKIEKCKYCKKIKISTMTDDDWYGYKIPKYKVTRFLCSDSKLLESNSYETHAPYYNIVNDYLNVGYLDKNGKLICDIVDDLYYMILIEKIK